MKSTNLFTAVVSVQLIDVFTMPIMNKGPIIYYVKQKRKTEK